MFEYIALLVILKTQWVSVTIGLTTYTQPQYTTDGNILNKIWHYQEIQLLCIIIITIIIIGISFISVLI